MRVYFYHNINNPIIKMCLRNAAAIYSRLWNIARISTPLLRRKFAGSSRPQTTSAASWRSLCHKVLWVQTLMTVLEMLAVGTPAPVIGGRYRPSFDLVNCRSLRLLMVGSRETRETRGGVGR